MLRTEYFSTLVFFKTILFVWKDTRVEKYSLQSEIQNSDQSYTCSSLLTWRRRVLLPCTQTLPWTSHSLTGNLLRTLAGSPLVQPSLTQLPAGTQTSISAMTKLSTASHHQLASTVAIRTILHCDWCADVSLYTVMVLLTLIPHHQSNPDITWDCEGSIDEWAVLPAFTYSPATEHWPDLIALLISDLKQ